MIRQRMLTGALAGLFLGLAGALIEWLHVSTTMRGVGFQPAILVYAQIVDGGVGLALGALAGLIWALVVGSRAQPEEPPAAAVDELWDVHPHAQVTVIWRGYRHHEATRQQTISRRAALRLGAAAASAGALGLGALAWSASRP